MIDRTVTFAKQHTPNSVRILVRRAMLEARNARLRYTHPVVARCEFENVYHCTVRKAASQWIKALFSDATVYRYSGLLPFERRLYRRRFPHAIPPQRAVLAVYASYKRFSAMPKPQRYRAFFVLRDPRDLVVSSYFSLRTSHAPMGDIPEVRKVLQDRPLKEGMLYTINRLADTGHFGVLRSWARAPRAETFELFRYEDLTGERQFDEVDRLMRHCGIPIPPAELEALLARHSFSRLQGPRADNKPVSHYRKGKAGDWRNYFDDELYDAFAAATGDLVELLGYPDRNGSPGTGRA
jgi:hypothetical protein